MKKDANIPGLLTTGNLLLGESLGSEAKGELQTGSSMHKASLPIVLAQIEHLAAAKRLTDNHKRELGFINRAILRKAIESQSLLVAPSTEFDNGDVESELAGMVHYYVRRDHVVTLCNIVVSQAYQHVGLGRQLFEELIGLASSLGKTQIRLKCPTELPANHFYERLGLKIEAVEPGKHRPLNVWIYNIN